MTPSPTLFLDEIFASDSTLLCLQISLEHVADHLLTLDMDIVSTEELPESIQHLLP